MKIFFDTNVYVADAIGGQSARHMIEATQTGRWRIYASDYVADEALRVLTQYFDFSPRLASVVASRIRRRAELVEGRGKARVEADPDDSPILQSALRASVDYLVTNDQHLLALNPYESLRIISLNAYLQLLREQGLL